MWQHSKKTKFKLHCSENGAQQFYKWVMCRTHRCAFWYIRKAQTGRIGIIIVSGMLLKGSGVETVELLEDVRDLRRWSLSGRSLEARPSPPPCFLTAMRQMNRFATPHSPQYCFSTLPKPKEPTNHKLNHEQEKSPVFGLWVLTRQGMPPLVRCVFLLFKWSAKVSCHSSCRLQLDTENTAKGQKRRGYFKLELGFLSFALLAHLNDLYPFLCFQRGVYIEKVFSSLPWYSASSEGHNNRTRDHGQKPMKPWAKNFPEILLM